MARKEGAALADLEAAFLDQDDLTQLFSDHIHPNDRGYQIMAHEFFKAITEPLAMTGSVFGLPADTPFDFAPAPPGAAPPHGRPPDGFRHEMPRHQERRRE